MKIGVIAIIPYSYGFLGLQCDKGRGLTFPGGNFEREKDRTFQDTAIRECQEEIGVTPEALTYVWHGPDGYEHTTFAFIAGWHSGQARDSAEGRWQIVTWDGLLKSNFAAYYSVLREVMESRGL